MLGVAAHDLSVVARGHGVKAKAASALEQQIKFDVTIAFNTGVRRLSRRVTPNERRDDVTFELLGVVKDVMIDAESLGDPPGVVHVADRAAARIGNAAPQLEGRAHDVVTLLFQETRRYRRVHPAAHRHQNFHGTSLPAGSLVQPSARS